MCTVPVQGIVYASRKRRNEEVPVPSEDSQLLLAEPTSLHSI